MGTVTGIVLGLFTIAAVFALIQAQAYIAIRSVRRSSGEAFIEPLVIFPQVFSQIYALADINTAPDMRGIRLRRSLILSVDKDNFRILGGTFSPVEIVSIPRARLRSIDFSKAQESHWRLDVISFQFSDETQKYNFDAPIRVFRFGFPMVQKGSKLSESAQELRSTVALGRHG